MFCLCTYAVVAKHDEQSEGLSRSIICSLVRVASGNKLSKKQSANCWDRTIFPLGRKLGLLCGYVKAQQGTSKRTASGNAGLQRRYHATISKLIDNIKAVAMQVLNGDEELVRLMLPWLIVNLDEECLMASATNGKVAGAKSKKKHDTQAGSSR